MHKPQSLSAALHRIGEVGGAGLSPAVLASRIEEKAPGLALDRIVAWVLPAVDQLEKQRRKEPVHSPESFVAGIIAKHGSKDPPGGQIVPSDLVADKEREERRAAAECQKIDLDNAKKSAECEATRAALRAGTAKTLSNTARPAHALVASAGGRS